MMGIAGILAQPCLAPSEPAAYIFTDFFGAPEESLLTVYGATGILRLPSRALQ
jgi:hypothetical protein